MNDPIIDDVFKSDRYSISLNQLLFTKRFQPNITSVSKLLDDNGYFGRYRIEQILEKKMLGIKIHVYLVDSGVTYIWPYDTSFNLQSKKFTTNRRVPRGLQMDKFMFNHCFRVLSIMSTPASMIEQPASYFDLLCLECMKIITDDNLSSEEWPWIISKNIGSFGQNSYYEKIIPFLTRLGLIVNNKFIIIGKDDAIEYPSNLFDIDYWHNI